MMYMKYQSWYEVKEEGRGDKWMISAVCESNLKLKSIFKSFMMIPQILIVSSFIFFCFQSKIWALANALTEIYIINGYY